MKHLIIHLDEHEERGDFIKKEFQDKIDWQFYPAVNYKNLVDSTTKKSSEHKFVRYGGDSGNKIVNSIVIEDLESNNEYKYIPAIHLKTIYKPYNPYLSDKQIALSISHINAIKYFFENNSEDYFVLCEDDIKFNSSVDISKIYSEMLALDFDFCLLCESPCHKMKRPEKKKINDSFYEIMPHHYSGSAAWCVNRSCYDIVKDMNIISFTSDDLYGILQVDCECKVISPYNLPFILNDLSKKSTLVK